MELTDYPEFLEFPQAYGLKNTHIFNPCDPSEPTEMAFALGPEMCVMFLSARHGVAPCPGTLT